MKRADGALGYPQSGAGFSSIFGSSPGWESSSLFPHQRLENRGPSPRGTSPRGPSPRRRGLSPQAESAVADETPAKTFERSRSAGCWSEKAPANSATRGGTLFSSPRRMGAQAEFSAKFRSGQSPLRFSGGLTEEQQVPSRSSSKQHYMQEVLTTAITFGNEGGVSTRDESANLSMTHRSTATDEIVCGSGWASHARMTRKGRRNSPSPDRVPSRATVGGTKVAKGDWFEKMPSAAANKKLHPEKAHLPEAAKPDGGVSQKDALWRKLPEYSQCGNYLFATGRKCQPVSEADQQNTASQMYKMQMFGSAPRLSEMSGIQKVDSEVASQDSRTSNLNREHSHQQFDTRGWRSSPPPWGLSNQTQTPEGKSSLLRSPPNEAASLDANVLANGTLETKHAAAETAPAVSSAINGGNGFLDIAEKKLAKWKSFKERHGQDLQFILQQRGAGVPSENDASSQEPVCVASQIWSMRAPDKRRDAKCPIRAASMTDLSMQKDLATYGVHPVAPRNVVAARRHHQAPAQWKY